MGENSLLTLFFLCSFIMKTCITFYFPVLRTIIFGTLKSGGNEWKLLLLFCSWKFRFSPKIIFQIYVKWWYIKRHKFYDISQLVRLRGTQTAQRAHCALLIISMVLIVTSTMLLTDKRLPSCVIQYVWPVQGPPPSLFPPSGNQLDLHQHYHWNRTRVYHWEKTSA